MQLASEMMVKKVSVKAKLVGSQMVRKMTITLSREFGVDLCRQLGGKSKELLESLRSGGATDVTIPIDSVVAKMELHISGSGLAGDSTEDRVVLDRCFGKKAKATAPKSDDTEPDISLDFELLFDERAWAWSGRNVGAFATVEITPAQLELTRRAS